MALGLSASIWAGGALAHGGGGGGGGGHGGGHGGGRTVVIVGYGGGYDIPLFRGDQAAMTLEITDASPTAAEGEMKLGDVIAQHGLRSADSIVLTEPVKGRRREIPAGTALARMRFASGANPHVVWCDVRPTHRPLWPQEHDCLEDSHGDGRLDKLWQGDSSVHFLGFPLSGVGYYNDAMPTPAAYRPARPEERPTATLGFKYCDGDGVATPPRFALAVRSADDERWLLTGACRFGSWPDPADRTRVEVAGMVLSVTPGADGALRYKVVRSLPAEALGPLQPDAPLRSLADTPAPQQLVAERLALFHQSTLTPIAPAKAVTGPVGVGQAFVSVAVRHTFTGTLRNRIKPAAGLFWPTGTVMEVGQPMFGVPAPLAPGDGIAWCAPQLKDGVIQAACLLPQGDGYLWEANRTPAMAPTLGSLGFGSGVDPASSDPDVAPGPINDPPMTLTVRLASITLDNAGVPAKVYHLEYCLDWGAGPQVIERQSVEPPPAGRPLTLFGTRLTLKPAEGDGQMLVEAGS